MDEEESNEESIYSDEWIDQSVDDDELSATEAGFMQGYIESYTED